MMWNKKKIGEKMRRDSLKIIVIVAICTIFSTSLSATKYAGEIFKMGAGVRNFALGRTGLTDIDSPAMSYWNASLLLNAEDNAFELMHSEEFNGLLKYDTVSGYLGDKNVGFTLSRIGINNVPMTRLTNEDYEIGAVLPGDTPNRPYQYKSVNNSDYILYVGIARFIGSIPVGVTPKVAYRNLAETSAFGFGLDVSMHYEVSESFITALRIRDIIPTQVYWDTGTKEAVYTGFDVELQFKSTLPILDKPLAIFLNSEINTDSMRESSTVNIGDVSFDPHIGVELKLHPMVTLLSGYDIEYFTAGVGLNYKNFLLNYGYERNSALDNSHRISIGIKN